jgi:peptide deformylase
LPLRDKNGCLSIPGYYGVNIQRADQIVVKGQDMRGKPVQVKAQGYFAWALQHEIDHLNGVLYLDRLNRPEDLRRIREADDVVSEDRAEIDDLIER